MNLAVTVANNTFFDAPHSTEDKQNLTECHQKKLLTLPAASPLCKKKMLKIV